MNKAQDNKLLMPLKNNLKGTTLQMKILESLRGNSLFKKIGEKIVLLKGFKANLAKYILLEKSANGTMTSERSSVCRQTLGENHSQKITNENDREVIIFIQKCWSQC